MFPIITPETGVTWFAPVSRAEVYAVYEIAVKSLKF